MQNRDFKGVWIPKDIWLNEELTLIEKVYVSLYRQCNENVYETEVHMAHICSYRTMLTIRKHLETIGMIHEKILLSPYDAKQYAIENSHKGLECEWCGKESNVLQKHHFPILAKYGGKDTVNICPNCHYTYHKVMGEIE